MRAADDRSAADNYAIDPVTQHLLEVSIGLMQNPQVMTQELVTLRSAPAAAIPIPDPARKAQKLIPNMTTDDDVKAFLSCFERTAECKDWLSRDWACLVAPLLTGEAQ